MGRVGVTVMSENQLVPEDDGYCGVCLEFFLCCECGNVKFKEGKAYSKRLEVIDNVVVPN
jgi:hypothetical protein